MLISVMMMGGCGESPQAPADTAATAAAEPVMTQSLVLPADATGGVLIEVTDGSGMLKADQTGELTIYMARSTDGWDPAGLEAMMVWMRGRSENGSEGWAFLLLPHEIERHPDMEFKFTRGDWATVEVDAHGGDIANRSLAAVDWASLDRRDVLGRKALVLPMRIEGFADQRGTRWAMAEQASDDASSDPRSTVVGTLEIHTLDATTLTTPTRTIRVWLPEGYHDAANAGKRYPVLYMHDGQNLFDAATSGFGSEWRVDETMTALIAEGAIEPWIVVGIDHAGEHRVGELSPDGVRVRGQTGSGSGYLAFVVETLIPWVEAEYRVLDGAAHRALGGSSCGGNITVQAMLERPGVFSRLLIESPALWIGDEVLTERARGFTGAMPERVFIAMGTAEYGEAARDAGLVRMGQSLGQALTRDGHPAAVQVVIEEGGRHHEDTWAGRLPKALIWLLR